MKSPVVVADTTPLNYLILIGRADVLGKLFGGVLIPQAVADELRHPKAPEAITHWLRHPPAWLSIAIANQVDETILLGKGESQAISLALECRVKVVLMDERLGRRAAEARGLIPVGTLNVIDLADELRLLDGIAALHDLRQTTFRCAPQLLGRFEDRMQTRRG